MLTDEDKNRLRLEEIFRQEVRQEIEENKKTSSRTQKTWSFLNSNFGLFVFSIVFVSIFSWGYTHWNEYRKEKSQNAATARRLDAEITNRIEHAEKILGDELRDIGSIHRAIWGGKAETSRPSQYTPIFSEFTYRSLYSLLWELEYVVPAKQVNEVKKARGAAKKIPLFFTRLIKHYKSKKDINGQFTYLYYNLSDEDKNKYRIEVLRFFELDRWKKYKVSVKER